MNVVLADNNKADLGAAARACEMLAKTVVGSPGVLAIETDVSVLAQVVALKQAAYKRFGRVDFLMNNAATQNNGDGSAIEHMDRWTDVLGVNLMGVVHGCQAFGEAMVAQQRTAVIVNTGSKQGITMPPVRPSAPLPTLPLSSADPTAASHRATRRTMSPRAA